LQKYVDTLLVIPNQNLFRVANEKTTFADAFAMADQVLYSGVACITDLMVKEGLINLDFADVRAVMREMGKAMMGTGEASGEKRASTAAEAAISNPLIDDSSMKGAKGLLISITGGKDLTLYEVDEAATRIREEVDKDANIIVGATFDESLEGIIRVSVVATGIDKPSVQKAPETVQRARTEAAARIAERTPERIERAAPSTQAPAPRPAAPAVEQAATAAVAAALSQPMPQPVSIDDVTLRAIPQKPSLFVEPPVETPQRDIPPVFVPPQPERVLQRPRMPRIDELPAPAQRQLRARQGEPVETEHPEKQRMTLLQRLAAAGLGRKVEEPAQSAEPATPPAPPTFERMPQRPPAPRPANPSLENRGPVSDYAPRAPQGQPQGLDQHGRPAPVHNPADDDQLDIPAFLRRQAN
jgi:cell division protein FtsZ